MLPAGRMSLRAVLPVVLASSSLVVGAAAQDPRSALDTITSAVIEHPITTTSDTARMHFLAGLRELDLTRLIDANEHFKAAVAADSNFAFAYLNVANTANSLEEFKSNLARAERHAAGASDAEQLQIQMARKAFDNDLSGQLTLGQQLVEKYPKSPRAWLALAGAQIALNQNVEARASLAKALELAPRLFAAHAALGNSYVFGEPRDFAKALEHMQAAESLAPNEAGAHLLLGDAYRAQLNLTKAREEYRRGHELNPRDATLLVKAGHADTFLGDFAAARADYDSAVAAGRGQEKATYALFRANVPLYAGDPAAAIDELTKFAASVDASGVPDPTAAKVGAFAGIVMIAIHTGQDSTAVRALKELSPLLLQQADQAGSPAFRRTQQATIAYFDGWRAARHGEYATARRDAVKIKLLLVPDSNPRKLEPVHQLEGFISLYQGHYGQAVEHLRQGNPLDPYVKYQLAVAMAGAGDAAQAKRLYREVADYNFNVLGWALVRKDAQQKAGGTL